MTDTSAPRPPPGIDTARNGEASPEPGTARGRRVVLVTGLSGAGISTALKSLEDLGHEAVDNLPLAMVPALIEREGVQDRPLAVSIDSRNRDFSAESLALLLEALRRRGDLDVRLLFVDCDADVLQRRFTETRRRHPLALDRPVADGIRREQVLLAPLLDLADARIDTSILSIHDLRRWLAGSFSLEARPQLFVSVQSFSYRHGLPREADLVFDVRFLANPHWDPKLRPLTGRDAAVRAAVEADPDYAAFFEGLTALLEPLLPRFASEGKSYLTIAIGCTGGQHRSVSVAEALADRLARRSWRVGLLHRDLPS